MAKLYKIQDWEPGLADLYFHCPGCKCDHGVWTTRNEHPVWDFNGDMDKPTFKPSIMVTARYKGIDNICHSIITDGKIAFQGDCTHDLAGQTVELPDIESKIEPINP